MRPLYLCATCLLLSLTVFGGCRGRTTFRWNGDNWVIRSQRPLEYERLYMSFNMDGYLFYDTFKASVEEPPIEIQGATHNLGYQALDRRPEELKPAAVKVRVEYPARDEANLAEAHVDVFFERPNPSIERDDRYIKQTRVAKVAKSSVDELILDLEANSKSNDLDNDLDNVEITLRLDGKSRDIRTHEKGLLETFVEDAWYAGR